MANIKIEGAGAFATVSVDGVPVRGVVAAALTMLPDEWPRLDLRVAATEQSVEITEATLVISGLEVPESVEQALLEYLCRKYPLSTAFKRGSGGLFDAAKGRTNS